jgi:hypothetical protein
MNKSKRARKTGRLTADEFVEYMTVKTMEHLSKMPLAERKVRLAAARRVIAGMRTKPERSVRTRVSQTPSRAQ